MGRYEAPQQIYHTTAISLRQHSYLEKSYILPLIQKEWNNYVENSILQKGLLSVMMKLQKGASQRRR